MKPCYCAFLLATLALSVARAETSSLPDATPPSAASVTLESSIAPESALSAGTAEVSGTSESADSSSWLSNDSAQPEPSFSEMYARALKTQQIEYFKEVRLAASRVSPHAFLIQVNDAFTAALADREASSQATPATVITDTSAYLQAATASVDPSPLPSLNYDPANDTVSAPEPSTWALVGLGAAGLAILKRMRQTKPSPVPVKA